MTATVWFNIEQLVTLAPLAAAKRGTPVSDADLGIVSKAWLVARGGKIEAFGPMPLPPQYQGYSAIDARGHLVLPGLVDAHTHLIFAGERHNEIRLRLNGATYQEIAAAGGGIKATVTATRQASDADLVTRARYRLQRFLQWGVTTVEAKSGYGLSVAEELRHLRLLKTLQQEGPQTMTITCLALHALPLEETSTARFVTSMTEELLPQVAKEGLASAVDAFIEAGYFSPEEAAPFFHKARELGLKVRVHADEFSASGGAEAAAHWGAASADHLQFARRDGLRAMASAGVTAVLLPGTSLFSRIPFTDAGPIREAGCALAVATDFNPGSCPLDNLPFLATMAAIHCRLSFAETIASVTYVPALSLGLGERKGALAPGFDADLLLFPGNSAEQWLADCGRQRPTGVWIEGEASTRL